MGDRSILHIADILVWAQEYHSQHGRWPMRTDGRVAGKSFTWSAVDSALSKGHRGLRGGSSLAQLLKNRFGRRHKGLLPVFEIKQILAWADAHHKRTKTWPSHTEGKISGAPGETWDAVNAALHNGLRGLPGGSSLPQLLAERRGVRNIGGLPDFTIEEILAWADAFHARTGAWPTKDSGSVELPPGETWSSVNHALKMGSRGLLEGGSLTRLLAEHRGVRNEKELPDYSISTILAWADAHFERTGHWPTTQSGPIPEAAGEAWTAVNSALHNGRRGLPPGDSLPRLLARERGVRNRKGLPKLSISKILAWAKEFQKCHGRWPVAQRDNVVPGQDLTWVAVDEALKRGLRGLPGGSSLAKLLMERCGHRHNKLLPKLTTKQILAWADAHYKRTKAWPHQSSGRIIGARGENWHAVDAALRIGSRGLPGGSSLPQLLSERRGVRNHLDLPPLTADQILAWADAFQARLGYWPTRKSGSDELPPEETWSNIDNSLYVGLRGLPKGGSLPRLLALHRGVRNRQALPKLQVPSILAWADAHYKRFGQWPNSKSGPVPEAPGETWSRVDISLRNGARGFPGGDSLFRLLQKHGRAGGKLQRP